MWRLFLLVGGVGFLIGHGFICPALQEILFQEVHALAIALLTFGVAICASGAWSFAHGIKRLRGA